MLFIGDVHIHDKDSLERYHDLLINHSQSVQVGDFSTIPEIWDLHNNSTTSSEHKILQGNHDNMDKYPYSRFSLGNYGIFTIFSTLRQKRYSCGFIRGAKSIDSGKRPSRYYLTTEENAEVDETLLTNVTHWENEELDYHSLCNAVVDIIQAKPDIIITHDCPQSVCESLFGITDTTKTRNALNVLFSQFQPKIWVFGHHHKDKQQSINGTEFVCLDMWSTLEI